MAEGSARGIWKAGKPDEWLILPGSAKAGMVKVRQIEQAEIMLIDFLQPLQSIFFLGSFYMHLRCQ